MKHKTFKVFCFLPAMSTFHLIFLQQGSHILFHKQPGISALRFVGRCSALMLQCKTQRECVSEQALLYNNKTIFMDTEA